MCITGKNPSLIVVGFVGPHNTGKTTQKGIIEKLVAEDEKAALNVYPFEFSVSASIKRHGFETDKAYGLKTRLVLQQLVFADWIQAFQDVQKYADEHYAATQQKTFIVMDRTPLDFAGYLMAEIGMKDHDDDLTKDVEGYFNQCRLATCIVFDMMFLFYPNLPLEAREGRGKLDKLHIHQVYANMYYFFNTLRNLEGHVIEKFPLTYILPPSGDSVGFKSYVIHTDINYNLLHGASSN